MGKRQNNNNKNKGGKPFDKSKDKVQKNEVRDNQQEQESSAAADAKFVKGGINDSSFYYESKELAEQVQNYSFNDYIGVPVSYKAPTSEKIVYNPTPDTSAETPSSLMTIALNPSVAPTGDPTTGKRNGINLAALKIYLTLSKSNAKTTQYGPEDVSILILALAEIIKMVTFLTRFFGWLEWFNVRNRTIPELLFKACGVDFADFKANAADYRIRLNSIINNINKLPIPTNIPWLDKAAKWFNTVYVDESSPMRQRFVFVPFSTWTLDEAGTTQGSVLTTTYVVGDGSSGQRQTGLVVREFSYYLDVLDNMVQQILVSSTIQAIFSDIMRVASTTKEFKTGYLDLVAINEKSSETYSPEIRTWIHNMMIIGEPVPQDGKHVIYEHGNTGDNDVWASAEYAGVIYNPEFEMYNANWCWRIEAATGVTNNNAKDFAAVMPLKCGIVDFDKEAPSLEERVAATRLSARGNAVFVGASSAANGYDYWYCNDMAIGDAYVVCANMYSDCTTNPIYLYTAVQDVTPEIMSKVTDFNWFPILYACTGTATTTKVSIHKQYEIGDLNYWTTLDDTFMRRMYDTEMLGLLSLR